MQCCFWLQLKSTDIPWLKRPLTAWCENDNCPSMNIYVHSLWPPLWTLWSRVTHICVNKLTIIGSDNGLLPGWRQAIIWTSGGKSLMQTLGTNFSKILSEINAVSFTKMNLKMSSVKWRQFCLGFSVLTLAYDLIWQLDRFKFSR